GVHGGWRASCLGAGGVRILSHALARTRADVRHITGADHAAISRGHDPALRHLPPPGVDWHADAGAGTAIRRPVRDAVFLSRAGDLPAAPVLPCAADIAHRSGP